MRIFALFVLLMLSRASVASPCDGVSKELSAEQQVELTPILTRQIANQIEVQSVKVLESFHYRNWYIFYVAPDSADEVFLFYSDNPTKSSYLLAWPDAFSENDEKNVLKAVSSGKTKGIPEKLAACFAWRVTNARAK